MSWQHTRHELVPLPPGSPDTYASRRSGLSGNDYEWTSQWDQDISRRQIGYLSTALCVSVFLLLAAIPTLIYALMVLIKTRHKSDGAPLLSSQSIPLITASCDSNLSTYNLVAHLVINLLGTIVLACSNYLQQLAASPSFDDIKNRILAGKDVRFGTNSPSAVFRQRGWLIAFWFFLVLTSLPIHLLINGIIGEAITPIQAGCQAIQDTVRGDTTRPAYAGNWTYVASAQCAKLLLSSIAYVTDFKNITILVNPNSTAPLAFYNDYLNKAGNSNNYVPEASDISICYVDEATSTCQLTVRWFPLLCTAGALILKSVIALWFIFKNQHFHHRVFNCLGDMIAVGARHKALREYARDNRSLGTAPYQQLRIRWFKALGFGSRVFVFLWTINVIGVVGIGIYLWISVSKYMSWGDRYRRFGLGTIDPATSIVLGSQHSVPNTFPVLVVIANSPQLLFSVGYLFWNNQITQIYMEREWRAYYGKRKRPRVSYPIARNDKTKVKTSRWLQLPYWITIVWMILNSLMHWLLSQTLFVVEILGRTLTSTTFYINYSPMAVIAIGILASVLSLVIIGYFCLPRKSWMPLMGGSLLIVFESCLYLPYGPNPDLPTGGIMWGDISTPNERRAGFGPTAKNLVLGAVYPGDRLQEPMNIRYLPEDDGSSLYSERAPLVQDSFSPMGSFRESIYSPPPSFRSRDG